MDWVLTPVQRNHAPPTPKEPELLQLQAHQAGCTYLYEGYDGHYRLVVYHHLILLRRHLYVHDASQLERRASSDPPGSIILVTGVNGSIASHVADQLIQAGYIVRGTTSNIVKTAWMEDMVDAKYGRGKIEMWWNTSQISELLSRLTKVLRLCKGYHFQLTCARRLVVAGVVHVASIVTFDPDPLEVIPVVVAGALKEVFAASRMPSIKRVVYTSSSEVTLLPKTNFELNISTED